MTPRSTTTRKPPPPTPPDGAARRSPEAGILGRGSIILSPSTPYVKTELISAEQQAQGDGGPHYFKFGGVESCFLNMGIAELDRALVEALPDTLADMSRVVGVRAVLKIAERFGGKRLFFAKKPKGDGALARLVGVPAARALGQYYEGGQLEIPHAKSVVREIRNREVCRLREQGVSCERVALKFDMTIRHVRRIYTGKETKS